jgi:hypothetical protein
MDNRIKIYELVDNIWKEGLNFEYILVGKSLIAKTLCFSPEGCDIADLKVMIEPKNDFVFTKSADHLDTDWKSISPFKLKSGEMSNPIKLDFVVKSGPVRMDTFNIRVEYLEIPND